MSIIQKTLIKFLSNDSRKEIARETALTEKELVIKTLETALNAAFLDVTTDYAVKCVMHATSATNGGALTGNNTLQADKAARTFITASMGQVDRDTLSLVIALGRRINKV